MMSAINTYRFGIDRTPVGTFLDMLAHIDKLEKKKLELMARIDELELEIDGGDEVVGYMLRNQTDGSYQMFSTRGEAQNWRTYQDELIVVKKGDPILTDFNSFGGTDGYVEPRTG
jgi:hypothetical protein